MDLQVERLKAMAKDEHCVIVLEPDRAMFLMPTYVWNVVKANAITVAVAEMPAHDEPDH